MDGGEEFDGGGSWVNVKWYLVKTKPRNENRVYTRLDEAGFESIYPRIEKKSRKREHPDIRPLFPTYLFVRFAIEQLRTIRYTRGVAKVVTFGEEPQEVGEDIIAAVRERMDQEGIVTLVRPPDNWKTGDKIRIGEGPFAGLEAIFLEKLPDRDRVVLLLEAVSSFRVTIDKELIER
jgi:transcriptional antiterminator RfaH